MLRTISKSLRGSWPRLEVWVLLPMLFTTVITAASVSCLLATLILGTVPNPNPNATPPNALPLISEVATHAPQRQFYTCCCMVATILGMMVIHDLHNWFTRMGMKCRRMVARQCPKSIVAIGCTSAPVMYLAQLSGHVSMIALALQSIVTMPDDADTHGVLAKVTVFGGLAFEAHACMFIYVLSRERDCDESRTQHHIPLLAFSFRLKFILLSVIACAMISFPVLIIALFKPDKWWQFDSIESWTIYVIAMGNVRPVLEWTVCTCMYVFFGTFSTDLCHAWDVKPSNLLVNSIALVGFASVPVMAVLMAALGFYIRKDTAG